MTELIIGLPNKQFLTVEHYIINKTAPQPIFDMGSYSNYHFIPGRYDSIQIDGKLAGGGESLLYRDMDAKCIADAVFKHMRQEVSVADAHVVSCIAGSSTITLTVAISATDIDPGAKFWENLETSMVESKPDTHKTAEIRETSWYKKMLKSIRPSQIMSGKSYKR
jgi:hypothetical protein